MRNKLAFLSLIAVATLYNCQSVPRKNSANTTKSVNKKNAITAVQLTEQTRGLNKLYTITEKEIKISENNAVSTKPNTYENWQNLTALITSINYRNADKFQPTSDLRSSDRAASSQLIFLQAKEKYSSEIFDAGNPPKELQNIYTEVLKNLGKGVKKPKSSAGRSR